MKKLLLLVLLIPALSFAQPYVPIVSTTDSSDTWFDVYSCTDFNCYFTSIKRYNVAGDTSIGAHQYAKLVVKEEYEEGKDQSQWCDEYSTISEYYFGGIRENNKQVFVLPNGGTEYLAYDFNLVVGDTVPSPAQGVTGDVSLRVIDSIDMVTFGGVDHKRIWLQYGIHIIEGIGASGGLFNPITHSSMCHVELMCYSEYQSPQYFNSNCDMNIGIEELSMLQSDPNLVKIVDILGREIKEQPNIIMIYIYDDGSYKKVFKVE